MPTSRVRAIHRTHTFLATGSLIAAIAMLAAVSSAWAAPGQASDVIPNHYIVVFKDSVDSPGALAETQTEQRDGDLGFVYRHALKGYSAELSKGAVEALRQDPRVKYVAPDHEAEAFSQTIPTGVKRIFAAERKDLDIDETDDVRVNADVAVVDTGVDFEHPDLNVVARTDCSGEGSTCVDNSGTDKYGHGTHVAGIVGALDNSIGSVGVAPGARIWAVKVLNDSGGGSESGIAAGIDWVTAHATEIEVANMSLGCPCPWPVVNEAINASVEAGVVYTLAAGNEDQNVKNFDPAGNPNAITVSALTDYDGLPGGLAAEYECTGGGQHYGPDDRLASYSNWGSEVDIAAPGSCIYSTLPTGGSFFGANYKMLNGTSMAAPHVAAAAAILASESNPNSKADVEAIKAKLIQEGSLNWTDNSRDGIHERLLDLRSPGREAITFPASNLQPHGAQLNGAVSAGGLASTYRFEYGTSTKYGTSIPASPESIGSGTGDIEVSKQISVEPRTTYHYRVVVTNSAGTSYGADKEFTTSLWSIQATPVPSGGSATQFTGISCTSTSACIGVGSLGVSSGNFAERWNGSEWSLQSVPNPSGGTNPSLSGVSCASSSSCIAIGKFLVKTHYVPFAERWDGTSWSALTMPTPSGLVSNGNVTLSSVSCPTTTYCVAVGGYVTATLGGEPTEEKTLVERWNGSEWAVVASPNPAGKKLSQLRGVSCTSASVCMAAGSARTVWTSAASVTLAERWNGSEWALQTTPNPAGAEVSLLNDVSCSTATACMAVGNGLAEAWDGTEWKLSSSSLPTLYGVSCVSATSCTAVGGASGQHWNGSGWSVDNVASPEGGSQVGMGSISCPSATTCSAAGGFLDEQEGRLPLAERTAPQWPVVTTEAASAATAAEATLKASVNPEGIDTSYQFEYGRSTSYGQSVPLEAKSIGKEIADIKVSQGVSGLEPHTAYHFRVLASNSEGTSYGADQTFTTGSILHWYGCSKQSGKYTSSKCATEGSPNEWESVRLKEGEKVTIAAKGNPIAYTSTQVGLQGTLSCETEVSSPSLENPSGASNGLGAAQVKYKGCKAEGTGWEGCKAEPTASYVSKAELVMTDGKAQVMLKPSEGTTFATFSFSGCKETALNGSWSLTGTMRGLYSNASSRIELNAETTAEGLKLRGQKATAVGSLGLETSGGGYVKAEPEIYWYGCNKQAGGKYTSSKCATEGSPNEWESVRLKEGEKVTIAAKGNPIAYTATVVGLQGTLSCETEVSSPSLENPSGAGNGIGSAQVKYKGCKVEGKWENCKAEQTASYVSKVELVTVEGKAQVVLRPSEGATFATFSFSSCKEAALNGSWSLTGTATGLSYSNSASQLELNTAQGLKLRSQKATAVGAIGLETSGGGYVRAE